MDGLPPGQRRRLSPDGAAGRDPAHLLPVHGRTLGAGAETIAYQSDAYPENVRWAQSGATFAAVHIVGSDDNQATWFGDRVVNGVRAPETAAGAGPARAGVHGARSAATLASIDATFDAAERDGSAAVAIGMQANMGNQSAFAPIQAKIAERATRFAKPVLLMEGDSHLFLVDRPAGMPANVTRFVVQGSTNTPRLWLRLHVDGGAAQPFACENVEYRTGAVRPCPAPLAPIATAPAAPSAARSRQRSTLTLGVPTGVRRVHPRRHCRVHGVDHRDGHEQRRGCDPERGRPERRADRPPGQRRLLPAACAAGLGGLRSGRRGRCRRASDVLRSFGGPVSGDVTTVAFRQAIGASDALRTGTYAKTLTFTLSTTTP